MEKLLYRDTEVCQMTGLGRTTIWQAIRSGRLESVKIGAARRIPADAVVKFVESLRAEAEA